MENYTAAVKAYWEDPRTISIIDKNLHELEISTVCKHLLPTDFFADIGCGDGEGTVRYAAKVRKCVGIERSDHLRGKALEAAARSGLKNISIESGDIMEMSNVSSKYDVVLTQRLLINLGSWEEQMQALKNIHRLLKVGGRYIAVENSNDAFGVMNDMRTKVGLAPIPQHWHNRFFDYEELIGFLRGKFQLLKNYDFGLYYFLTRVYVPLFAEFVGFGANAVKDPIYEKSDAAARTMFELFGDRIHIEGCRAFGPIQVFVFRREAAE